MVFSVLERVFKGCVVGAGAAALKDEFFPASENTIYVLFASVAKLYYVYYNEVPMN